MTATATLNDRFSACLGGRRGGVRPLRFPWTDTDAPLDRWVVPSDDEPSDEGLDPVATLNAGKYEGAGDVRLYSDAQRLLTSVCSQVAQRVVDRRASLHRHRTVRLLGLPNLDLRRVRAAAGAEMTASLVDYAAPLVLHGLLDLAALRAEAEVRYETIYPVVFADHAAASFASGAESGIAALTAHVCHAVTRLALDADGLDAYRRRDAASDLDLTDVDLVRVAADARPHLLKAVKAHARTLTPLQVTSPYELPNYARRTWIALYAQAFADAVTDEQREALIDMHELDDAPTRETIRSAVETWFNNVDDCPGHYALIVLRGEKRRY